MRRHLLFLIPLAAIAVAGCSGSPEPSTPSPTPTASATSSSPAATPEESTPMPASPSPDDPDKVLDLNGDWKQTNAESPDAWQAATIADGMITILWVSDGGDTTTLYWAGSFDAPTEKGGTYSWTSKNDHGQTDGAAQGSKEDTKKFSYADGVLSYSVTVDDEASTVELGRMG